VVNDDDAVGQLEVTLNSVDEALDRLRDGTYRACATCGSAIGESLLVNDPLRTQCANHLTLR